MAEKIIRPRRSLLFVPGLRPDRFAKALNAGADIVCVDIEDAVALPRKQEARELTMPLFAAPAPDNVETMVRINPLSSEEGLKDILALKECDAPPAAIMIAKPGSAAEIALYDELLSGTCSHIRFHVIIESTDGLANVDEIARSSDRIDSLLFGAVDMSADLRAAKKWETLLYARSRVVHAAARYNHDLLDVPWLDLEDQDGLAVEARASNGRRAQNKSNGSSGIAPIVQSHDCGGIGIACFDSAQKTAMAKRPQIGQSPVIVRTAFQCL